MPDELHPRHLVVRVVEVAAIIAVVAIAITALPGLDQVKARLEDASAVWVVAVAVAEVGSCLGYLLVFRETFCSQMSWGLSYDIAMSEQAANSLLPAGGAGGLALGVWALRQAGMPTAHIARRTVAFFVITSAANFFALIVVGHRRVPRHHRRQGIGRPHARAGADHRVRRAPRRVQPATAARARPARRGRRPRDVGRASAPDAAGLARGRRRRSGSGDRAAARAQHRRDRRLVLLHGVRHRGARVRASRRSATPRRSACSCSAT